MELNYKIITAALIGVLVLSVALNVNLYKNKNTGNLLSPIVQTVSAQEIYPMFVCPCCGQPLDKKNICCGEAQERIDFIDSLVAENFSDREIIFDYIKKFGLNSFADSSKKEEFKAELAKIAPADRPTLEINPLSIDLGDVSQKEGIATTIFEIKNAGKENLVINRLDSSCGCTSAAIVYKGSEGPKFAMAGHGAENPTDWQVSILPGETAQLKVYYDPNVHKDLRGPVIREVYIYSNDPVEFEKKVQIELNQID